ncbi:MAG: LPS assembly protein LptD [Candidatus Accumulibacter sp.]|jgi:LPS-assembly protein|nr:LPS assembly protein LptD [Accumulibacter sp.]
MNRINRHKRLVLLLGCGLAGVFAGACPSEAATRTPALLKVDPALLGPPPAATARSGVVEERRSVAETRSVEPEISEIQPLALPEPAKADIVDEAPEARQSMAEVRPVGPEIFEVQPLVPLESAKTGVVDEAETPASSAPAPSSAPETTAFIVEPPRSPSAEEKKKTGPTRADEGIPNPEPTLILRASTTEFPPRDGSEPRPVFLSARRMAGEVDREFIAEGDVELRRDDSVVNSDLMTYWPLEDEVEAEGRVRLQQANSVVTGPKMRLRLEDRIGYFEQPSYQLRHQSLLGRQRVSDREDSNQRIESLTNASQWNTGFATPQVTKSTTGQMWPDDETRPDDETGSSTATKSRGEAERIDFEGENQYRLLNNTFTTCPVDNDAWYVRTSELRLDYDYEVADGKDATVYFKGVPILYSPWFSFSLNRERKSGFLPPSIGTNSDNGFEYQQPYYWNIAPNMDATISPRLMTRRGIQFGSKFRYLNTALGGLYRGEVGVEYLPGDRQRDRDNRHAFSLAHEQATGSGFHGTIDFSKVSDDNYYTDLSSDISRSSQTQLLQQGMLSYSGSEWWNASINFTQYQTLQPDENNPVLEQYRMLPQVTFNARQPDFHGMDLDLLGQYTRFSVKEREQFGRIFPDGNRAVFYPRVSLPYVTPGWYVTPRLGVNYRHYSLSGQPDGRPDSISVTLPVFSVDSGMIFERSSRWFSRDYTQTLEPRLYYVNIPYKDQSDIPLFDTALSDFNFAQIFSENQFSSWDRVNNVNQLTAALTSRLIEPESGNEVMRAMVGQRFHFARNKVALNGTTVPHDGEKWSRSDFLAGFNGRVLPGVYADAAWQFDLNDRHTERYSVGVRYQPEPGKVLNLAYRYNRETSSPVNQVDVSGQWPLIGRWYGVGRLNYSFKDDGSVLSAGNQGGRVVESIAGLEYDGGCWVLRGVVRRQALTSEDTSTSFFVQLELSGLGRIGSSPLNLLKRNIQGYGLIGDSDSGAIFDD